MKKQEPVQSFSPLRWIKNKQEEILNKILPPINVNFKTRDILQIIVGATILAIPVGFTEEVWSLGGSLPILNILIILAISILFISFFTYYHYYHKKVLINPSQFTKRVIGTYLFSFIVVGILLTLIQVAPWTTDLTLAIKRTIIVTLPASMSATLADTIK